MSKIDFQENSQFLDNFDNEELFSESNLNRNLFSVPKLVTDLQQVIEDLVSKSSSLKNITSSLTSNTAFQVPAYLKPFVLENKFVHTVDRQKTLSQLHIGAVDGGLITSNLAGIDILGLKAIGVYLQYGNNKILKTGYYPKKHQSVTLLPVYKNFSRTDLDTFSSLQRSILELKAGITLLEESPANLDYLLMDGSFQLRRVSTPTTEINVLFGKYFAYLRKLIARAKVQNTRVLWVVKDSITSYFVTILSQLLPHIIKSFPNLYEIDYRSHLQELRDSNFMHYLLQPSTRSFIVNRSFNNAENLEISYNPYSYYLKVVRNDLPLRVDVLTDKDQVPEDVIANVMADSKVLLALSEFNQNFSLPAPIIEADARARINSEEFELILDYIRHKTFNYNSIEIQKLRRSRSPFRFT